MCLNHPKLVQKHPAHLVSLSLQGIEGMQGAICTRLTRFKDIEPHRTFSTCVLTDLARYIDFFHTSSGWFDWTKSSLTPSLRGIQGVQGASLHKHPALLVSPVTMYIEKVRYSRTTPNACDKPLHTLLSL